MHVQCHLCVDLTLFLLVTGCGRVILHWCLESHAFCVPRRLLRESAEARHQLMQACMDSLSAMAGSGQKAEAALRPAVGPSQFFWVSTGLMWVRLRAG